MTLQHLRSSTADKRPDPTAMADGQLAINTNATSPGLFYKDSTGALVKTGPVHVGTTAPNATPASGGTAGNSKGEAWLDTSGSNPVLKIWDGSAWQTVQPVASGTVVSTADTGTVTSTMIADGTIVDGDVNASAAIAGTKISPDFGAQNVTTTGTSTAASFTPTSSTVPTNGVYLPAANSLALSTNGTGRLFVDASGNVGVGTTPSAWSPATKKVLQNSSASFVGDTDRFEIWDNGYYDGANVKYVGNGTLSLITSNAGNLTFSNAASGTAGANATLQERLRITSAGLVGIGTSSPGNLLDCYGSSLNIAQFKRNTTGVAGGGIAFGNDTRTYSWLGDSAVASLYDNVAGAQRLVVDTSGRVGIGTTNPGERLHVDYGASSGNIRVDGTIGATNGFVAYSGGAVVKFQNTGGASTFDVGGTERARIDTSGRLLVGTSSTSVNFTTALLQGNAISSTAEGALRLARGSTPANGDGLGNIVFSDNGHGDAAYIFCARDGGTWNTSTSRPTRLVFSTTADGASSPTERMRIPSSGGLLINSTSRQNDGLTTISFDGAVQKGLVLNDTNPANTRQFINFFTSGTTTIGFIANSNNTGVTYSTTSDYRLKENVTAVTDGITRLQQLKPSRFNFIADPAKTVDGFLAHEVQTIVPEAVTGKKDEVDEDGNPLYQGIDQSKLVPLLTAALQEAVAKIESLEARLTAAGI